MTQTEKYNLAVKLLKEIGCPADIMDAIYVFGMFVHADEVKLHNWEALSQAGVIEGEAREVKGEDLHA